MSRRRKKSTASGAAPVDLTRPSRTPRERLIIRGLFALLIAVALWGVYRFSDSQRTPPTPQGPTDRLADQFRADVAAAKECRPLDEKQPESGIVLGGPGKRRVEYHFADQRLERTAYQGEHEDGRETFPLIPGRKGKFHISPEPPVVVTCVLVEGGDGNDSVDQSIRRITIMAPLGRDPRAERPIASVVHEPKATITIEKSEPPNAQTPDAQPSDVKPPDAEAKAAGADRAKPAASEPKAP